MPFKLTLDTFLSCLRRSGLVREDRVASLLSELAEAGVDVSQPNTIASALVRNRTLTRWQAEMLLRGKHQGFILGRYRLLSLLGRGGTSTVYLAEHLLMRRRCAIKVMPSKKLSDQVQLARFRREARTLASLEHMNIVRAYDADKALDGTTEVHLFVMEFVDGENLYDRVTDKGRMPPVEAANYIRQAADGLACAHSSGIVHRDVKPANLLVSPDDVIKILDLGLAKLFDNSAPAMSEKDRNLETADFVSPEQARDGQAVDHRADIYSLGCTFYFLLAGHPPFPNGTLAQRLASHVGKAPTSITEIRGDVPADLALILSRMMAKTPGDRYQTAEEVSEVLREWLVSHADSKWLRQHPAVLSPLSIPQEARARSSKGSNVPPAVSAAASGAVRTGSTSLDSNNRPSTKSASNAGSTPRPRQTSVGAQAGTDVTQVHLLDQQDSSAIDALIARRRRTPWVMRLRRSLSLEIIALGLTSVVAILGGLAWYASREKEPSPAPIDLKTAKQTALPEPQTAAAPPRRRIDGDIRVGPRGHFKTIAQAIDFVRESYANDMLFPTSKAESRTIKVAGWHSIYSEKIDIDNKDFHFPKGLRIICDDPVPAILSSPDRQSVVRLHGVERFTLEGFEIDATNQRSAIELSGYLVGTQLRNLKIHGDCETSIFIQGAMGLERPASRCVLDHLVLRRQRAGGTGVLFDKAADASSNLSIRGCRFFGPFDSAIAFGGPVSGIDVRESIITQASVGIRVEPAGLTFKDLAIVNNTFHKLDRAIVFRDMPPGAIIDLMVQRNLFTSVAVAEMFVEKGSNRAAILARFAKGAITGNWTSRKVGEPLPDGEINLFSGGQTGAALQFQTNDPGDDHFLWPVDHAPHKALGAVILK